MTVPRKRGRFFLRGKMAHREGERPAKGVSFIAIKNKEETVCLKYDFQRDNIIKIIVFG